MNKVIKNLNNHFYISIGFLAVMFLLVLIKLVSFIDITTVGIVAERYAIGLTLIAVSVSLKLFANILSKESNIQDEETAINTYKKATFWRLYIINTMTLINIILYAFSHNMNFVWLVVVLFIVYFFCRPSYVELESLIKQEEEEDNDE